MKYWAILLIALSFGACQNVKQPEKPKNLIGKDKMITILTEAYLANAARSVDNKSIMEQGIKMDSLFYTKFEVDSLQFARSNAFYASDVNLYITMFQEVEARLGEMVKHLDSIQKSKTQSKDSISPETMGRKPNLNPSGER